MIEVAEDNFLGVDGLEEKDLYSEENWWGVNPKTDLHEISEQMKREGVYTGNFESVTWARIYEGKVYTLAMPRGGVVSPPEWATHTYSPLCF